jgi:hypothetical protein
LEALELGKWVERNYIIFEVSGAPKMRKDKQGTKVPTRARTRGVAILAKRTERIAWAQEGTSPVGARELVVVATTKTTGEHMRFVAGYGPQSRDSDESLKQIQRLGDITRRRIGGRTCDTVWLADLNESDKEFGATTNSKNVGEANRAISALGMIRLKCTDAAGSQTTNRGTDGKKNGVPDWVVVTKGMTAGIRTEIIRTNRISAHSHEPIHVRILLREGCTWSTHEENGTGSTAKVTYSKRKMENFTEEDTRTVEAYMSAQVQERENKGDKWDEGPRLPQYYEEARKAMMDTLASTMHSIKWNQEDAGEPGLTEKLSGKGTRSASVVTATRTTCHREHGWTSCGERSPEDAETGTSLEKMRTSSSNSTRWRGGKKMADRTGVQRTRGQPSWKRYGRKLPNNRSSYGR